MAKKRKSHTATFKAQVALAAVKGDKTVSELASLHGVHPTMIHTWKKQLVENAEELFQSGAKASSAEHEALQAQLYEQIGRLKTELDWLKKKLPASVECKRAWVNPGDAVLSVSEQCELLGLSRSSYYYEPATESAENLALMALIDKEYTDHPFRGSRGMRSWLRQNVGKLMIPITVATEQISRPCGYLYRKPGWKSGRVTDPGFGCYERLQISQIFLAIRTVLMLEGDQDSMV